MTADADTTVLLQRWNADDGAAGDQVLRRFYDELRRLAAAQLAREHGARTVQATELVHEAWFQLCGESAPSFANRRHVSATERGAHSLSQALLHEGEAERAAGLLRNALAEGEQIYPGNHSNLATVRSDLARAWILQGSDAAARPLAQAALDTRREMDAPDPQVAEAELLLAVLNCRAGRPDARARIPLALQRASADPQQEPWDRQDLERLAAACPAT